VRFLHFKKQLPSTGRALIVRAHGFGYTEFSGQGASRYTATGGATLHSTLRLRVTPDDGSSVFESGASAWGGDEEHLEEGHETYVRYDPEDREVCDIDRDRLEHEFGRIGHKRRSSIPSWVSDEREAEQRGRADGTLKPGEKYDPLAHALVWSPEDPPAAPPGNDVVTSLKDLAEMHASGTLSDAEFAAAKARLLGSG
jgi:Short C-terminal domain